MIFIFTMLRLVCTVFQINSRSCLLYTSYKFQRCFCEIYKSIQCVFHQSPHGPFTFSCDPSHVLEFDPFRVESDPGEDPLGKALILRHTHDGFHHLSVHKPEIHRSVYDLDVDVYKRQELQSKLQSGGSLFYTWNGAGGSNFWNLLAYYGASPLYLILVLFPKKFLMEGVTLILLLKIGLAGSTMAVYLRAIVWEKDKRSADISLVGFATLYALCSYVMAYYWCIMWMDAVALLPLCILGLHKILDGRSGVSVSYTHLPPAFWRAEIKGHGSPSGGRRVL